MKEFIEKIKGEVKGIKGIVIFDLGEEKIVEKEGETRLFEEGIIVIGSTSLLALKKNISQESFDLIDIELKTGEIINILMKDNILLGVIGEEIDSEKLKNVISEFEPEKLKRIKEEVVEKEVEEKIEEEKPYEPSEEEKLVLNKVNQVNELIREFAPGDELRWYKVVMAKIKDTSPPLAENIMVGERELLVKLPFEKKIEEEEINKAFRAAIDIIWKMAVSKYGVEESRKRVKRVAERLKLI